MEKILAVFIAWLLGAPIYLPWILARFGHYKKWYFAPFIPPFSWRGWIQVWPLSTIFVVMPFLSLLPLTVDQRTNLWAILGIFGLLFAVFMMIWTPDWAKPLWQRRLEDLFSYQQISAFIKTWQKIPFDKWCDMIDTEEGMLELADYAIENQTQFVDDIVRIRAQQLTNAKKRNLKQKPKWLFQDAENQD